MLGLLLICASLDKFLVVLVAQNWNAKGSFLLFSIVNEIYENYQARSSISLFLKNELFSHHYRGLKLEICDPRNVREPICFPNLSNEYVSIFLLSTQLTANTIRYYVWSKLFTDDELKIDEASYSNNQLCKCQSLSNFQ